MSEALSPENKRAISEGLMLSLIDAGIGKTFHQRSLTETPLGESIRQWLVTEGRTTMQAGCGLSVLGFNTRDTFILAARACHLSGIPVQVSSVSRLIALIDDDAETLAKARDCAALFVTSFFDPGKDRSCPYSGWQVRRLLDLFHLRMDNQRSVCLHLSLPVEQSIEWYGDDFLQRVASNKLFKAVK
jgi:hypothetical protein